MTGNRLRPDVQEQAQPPGPHRGRPPGEERLQVQRVPQALLSQGQHGGPREARARRREAVRV